MKIGKNIDGKNVILKKFDKPVVRLENIFWKRKT